MAMKLLDEMRERREVVAVARDELRENLLQTEGELADLELAIAALEGGVMGSGGVGDVEDVGEQVVGSPGVFTLSEFDERKERAVIPDGFLEWQTLGVSQFHGDTEIEVVRDDGQRETGNAHAFAWEAVRGVGRPIVAYRVVTAVGAHDAPGYEDWAEEQVFRQEGWVPAPEFVFPTQQAIVEARWEDGYCETLEFDGYTPTTHEPGWRSPRFRGANPPADHMLVTHYRTFPLTDRSGT